MKTLRLPILTACTLALFAALTGCTTGPKFDARASSPVFASPDGTPMTTQIDPVWLKPGTNLFTLGPGDVVDLEIMGKPATRTTAPVGPDGKLYFSFLSGVDVWGLTMSETKASIEKELSRYDRSGVQVGISVRSVGSKFVWVLGRINKPGVYPITGEMTLLEAIAQAGGTALAGSPGSTEEQADLHHSFVERHGQILPIDFQKLLQEGDMSQNIYLQPDDFVYLPSTLFHEVFVLGSVGAPRAVPFSTRLTLVSAITASGGPIPGAYLRHVAIVRGSLTEPKVAIVDYKDIINGKAPDIALSAHDIVYVPMHPLSGLQSYAKIILSTFVNTIAANEGANAVTQSSAKVGIAITPGQ